jgi:hypothetical protein
MDAGVVSGLLQTATKMDFFEEKRFGCHGTGQKASHHRRLLRRSQRRLTPFLSSLLGEGWETVQSCDSLTGRGRPSPRPSPAGRG